MIHPRIDKLLENVNERYALVIVAAKRARQINKAIDYLATDIMRVADGLIVENWHVEDHETLHQQLAA